MLDKCMFREVERAVWCRRRWYLVHEDIKDQAVYALLEGCCLVEGLGQGLPALPHCLLHQALQVCQGLPLQTHHTFFVGFKFIFGQCHFLHTQPVLRVKRLSVYPYLT